MRDSDNTLLFLPDISGFTAFVNQTEINHSHHIVAELMENLLLSNQLNMDVIEIEGDAVFFYKTNKIPTLQELFRQTEQMFLTFHNHLQQYEAQRICKCGACSSANNLTLKFVAHSGPVQPIKIGKFSKLHGKDVIISHQLLKNEVPSDEYLLITKQLLSEMPDVENKSTDNFQKVEASAKYDHYGEVPYVYYDFNFLHKKVESYSREYKKFIKANTIWERVAINSPPFTLFEIISNLKYRKRWNKAIRSLSYNEQEVNHTGNMHTCVIKDMNLEIETLPVDTSGTDITYGERVARYRFLKNIQMFYIISPEGNKSHLTIEMSYQFVHRIFSFMKFLLDWRFKKMIKTLGIDIKTYAEQHHYTEPVKINIGGIIKKLEINEAGDE
ncbi:MAG: DUF2652 domain-containing protein [Bacteroidales bacterium]|nr:DUF2652 domain-containing protein [Bacteroidales bacterium]